MPAFLTRRIPRALALLGAVATLTTACDDDPTESENEPDTSRVVLTISGGAAAQTVTWNTDNGSVTPSTLTIPAGQTRSVTAQFLRPDNTPDPVITASDFRLDFKVVSGTGITVTKNGNLAATLTAGSTAAQSVTFTLELVHLAANHAEYTSSPGALTVTVQ